MPQLPVKQGTGQNFAPQQQQRVNPNAAGSEGRQLQSFGQSIQNIADTWKKAEVSTNYTTSRNSRTALLNQILADAENNPDSSSAARQEYIDQLTKIRDQKPQLGDERVQEIYDSESDLALSNAQIKIDQLYRQKMVKHQREQIVIDGVDTKREYSEMEWDELDWESDSVAVHLASINDEIKNHLLKKPDDNLIAPVKINNEELNKRKGRINRRISAEKKRIADYLDGNYSDEEDKKKWIELAEIRKKKIEKYEDELKEIDTEQENSNNSQLIEEHQKAVEAYLVKSQDLETLREELEIELEEELKDKFSRTSQKNFQKLNDVKAKYLERVQSAYESGGIGELEFRSLVKDTEDWEYERAIQSVSNDPNRTLQMLDTFNLNEKQRGDVTSAAKSVISRNSLEMEKAAKQKEERSYIEAMSLLYDNETLTNADKELELRHRENMGTLSSDIVSKAIRYLHSETSVKKQTSSREFAKSLRTMQTVIKKKSGGDRDPVKYLTKVNAYYDSILMSKSLTESDKKTLLTLFSGKTGKETGKIIDRVARRDELSKPLESFNTLLDSYLIDEAVLHYFRETQGKELTEEQQNAMILETVRQVDESFNERLEEANRKAIAKWGEGVEVANRWDVESEIYYIVNEATGDSIPLEKR